MKNNDNSTPIQVIVVNPPTKEEADKRIKELAAYLGNIWNQDTQKALQLLSLSLVYPTAAGGPDGELGASLRYLSQRYTMPYAELKGLLTDIGISCSR